MEAIPALAACIIISFIFSRLAKAAGVSVVIGLIAAGLFIGFPAVSGILAGDNAELIFGLGNIGFLLLMLLAGLEVSWSMLYRERKDALILALFAAFVPLFMGTAAMLLLGFPLLTSITVGACMSITAEATKARLLMEFGKLETRIGSLMMGAGILDDLLGLGLFLVLVYLATGTMFSRESLLVLGAIGSFFLGIAIHRIFSRETAHIKAFERLALALIVPFFFVSMGMHFDLYSLLLNPVVLAAVLSISVLGKITGSLLTKRFNNFTFQQLYLVGWGMNSRGAVELALAFIAFRAGFITAELYSALVLMALFTTVLFLVVFRGIVSKNPGIMD